jgi:folate-binding protein YgfZ
MLTPQGKFLYDFFIIESDNSFMLDIPLVHKEAILKKFAMYKLRSDVLIEDISTFYQCAILLGENIYSDIEKHKLGAVRSFCKGTAYLDPRSKNLFARAFIEAENHFQAFEAKGFIEGKEEEYDILRIANLVPDADKDMISGESFPLDFGMDRLGAIDFKKGCYVGQEVTARVHHKSSPKKAVYHLHADTTIPQNEKLVKNQENRQVGELLTYHETEALALLRKDMLEEQKTLLIGDTVLTVITGNN